MSVSAQPESERRRLTDEQELAVARRAEPLLLSAAAGSGKTAVLVERFVRAVREDGIAPAKILAITFTDRAAGELRERVRSRLLACGEREAARDTEAATIGTFHGFCARLLRAHPLLAGIDPEFTILDEGLAGRLREAAFGVAVRVFLEGERGDAVELIAAYGVDRVREMIEDVHARQRSRGERLPRLPLAALARRSAEAAGAGQAASAGEADAEDDAEKVDRARASAADDRDAAVACVLLDELLAGFGAAYEELKSERGALDFDDLELRAGELLAERESVRGAWSQRFELLMVDEFQDTNPRQLAILRALDRGNLFTVGDELQSIYGFRHAEVGLFRERRAELAELGGSLSLTVNFRSTAPLLEVVNTVFAARFAAFSPLRAARAEEGAVGGEEGAVRGGDGAVRAGEQGTAGDPTAEQMLLFAPENPESASSPEEPLTELLLTAKSGWEQDEELAAEIASGLPPGAIWRQAEARLLAQRIAELVRGGEVRAGEVVVLLRAAGDLEIYERALQLCGLRTLAAAGGFWAHQQIADLLSYLCALANPLDEEALYGALASPLVGVSRDALALLARAARAGSRGVWETLAAAPEEGLLEELVTHEREALMGFAALLASERETASQHTLAELIERAIDASGYREHVLALEWGERRLANVHKLLRLARGFEADEGRDLRGFLDHVARLQEAAARESDAPVEGVEPDAVRLMSVHAAKGLEFPVVCVADLGRAAHVRQPYLLLDGERIGLTLLRLDGAKAKPTLDYAELAAERRQADAEEEDRVLYVAMTRARERLLLSGAVEFDPWPEQRQGATMISWLGPALAAELPALALAEQPPTHDLKVAAARVRLRLNTPANAGQVLARGAMSLAAPRVPSYLRGDGDIAPGSEPLARAADGASAPAGAAAKLAMLSYTSLSELERCGYRYYLERVLSIPEVRPPPQARGAGVEARARGVLVHGLLETLDFRSPRVPDGGAVAERARELGIRVSAEEREEIAALIAAALAAAPAARVAAAVHVRREFPFAFAPAADPGEPLLTGVIDLLAEEPGGGTLVIDYKSDRVGSELDLAAFVEHEYGIQRLLYALAVLRTGVERVEIVHWFLERPHEPVAAVHLAGERPALEQRVAALLDAATAQRFEVSPRPHRGLCASCPGRASLCSWDEQQTMREEASERI
jgi:ATP-dependent helicase/nuclease subunit A